MTIGSKYRIISSMNGQPEIYAEKNFDEQIESWRTVEVKNQPIQLRQSAKFVIVQVAVNPSERRLLDQIDANDTKFLTCP